MSVVRRFEDLKVYQLSLAAAAMIFELTKAWPPAERFGLTSQILDSSRSVCSNIAEGWRTRAYRAWFVAKLTTAAGEASETRVWLTLALKCGYIAGKQHAELDDKYDHINAQLALMPPKRR